MFFIDFLLVICKKNRFQSSLSLRDPVREMVTYEAALFFQLFLSYKDNEYFHTFVFNQVAVGIVGNKL